MARWAYHRFQQDADGQYAIYGHTYASVELAREALALAYQAGDSWIISRMPDGDVGAAHIIDSGTVRPR